MLYIEVQSIRFLYLLHFAELFQVSGYPIEVAILHCSETFMLAFIVSRKPFSLNVRHSRAIFPIIFLPVFQLAKESVFYQIGRIKAPDPWNDQNIKDVIWGTYTQIPR